MQASFVLRTVSFQPTRVNNTDHRACGRSWKRNLKKDTQRLLNPLHSGGKLSTESLRSFDGGRVQSNPTG